jgi:hypothetical protein
VFQRRGHEQVVGLPALASAGQRLDELGGQRDGALPVRLGRAEDQFTPSLACSNPSPESGGLLDSTTPAASARSSGPHFATRTKSRSRTRKPVQPSGVLADEMIENLLPLDTTQQRRVALTSDDPPLPLLTEGLQASKLALKPAADDGWEVEPGPPPE